MKVKCYIIEAGPGDFGLLTLRGYEILCHADTIIYDHLIPEKCLQIIPSSCKKINVGKIPNQKSITQPQINQILVKECSSNFAQNKTIVRLKGGDPFIFGRGKEEITVLQKNKIPYQVIPGVSSFYAAPSYAGIPLTSRDYAENFTVITGHFQQKNNNKNIITSDSDTVVYLMGVNHLNKIVKANLKKNKHKTTPIAIIEKGCTPFQRTTTGTLENIIDKTTKLNPKIKNPAIILIGNVVSFRNAKNSWYENKELFQKKIVIFKEKKELPQLVKLLEEFGAIVIENPILCYKKVISYEKKLIEEIKKKYSKPTLLFTSNNAVNRFFEILKKQKLDNRILSNYKIVAVGKGTAESLKKYFIFPNHVCSQRNQEGIWKVIQNNHYQTVLYPRAEEARDFLIKKCQENKINLISIIIYKMQKKNLIQKEIFNADLMLFTSGNVVTSLENNFSKKLKQNKLPTAIAMGKNTASKLRRSNLNFSDIRKIRNSSYTEMVRECISFFNSVLKKSKN